MPLFEGGVSPSAPGVLGSGPSSVVSVHLRLLRPHPPVSRAHHDFTAWRLIRDAFAVRERLGDPRDLPYFRCRAFHACHRPYAGGSAPLSRCPHGAVPGFLDLSTSRHPQSPSLPAIPDGLEISTLHRSLHATARAFAWSSWLATTRRCHVRTASPSEDFVTPASRATRHRVALGIRLGGRTGNLPPSGLSPDQSRQLVRLHDKRSKLHSALSCAR